MVFNSSSANLPCFLLNSLEKMPYVVQNIVGDQDINLFHNCLLKIVIQYQLSMMGKNWDHILNENNFRQTHFWPSLISKTQLKRR